MMTQEPMTGRYEEYLRDESRGCGFAESISFPQTIEQAQEEIKALAAARAPVTVQGARTGICGGARPAGGEIPQPPPLQGGTRPAPASAAAPFRREDIS